MSEQLQSLADGLYQIGRGPTSLWLYVKAGVLHVPTKGLDPIAWLRCVVTVVNGRTFSPWETAAASWAGGASSGDRPQQVGAQPQPASLPATLP